MIRGLVHAGSLVQHADLPGVLRAVSGAKNYREWVFRKVEPELGLRVLDVGSGFGDFSDLFVKRQRRVLLSDASAEMTKELFRKTAGMAGVEVMMLHVAAADAPVIFPGSFTPDTVTCLNVLEHLEDDRRALENMRRWVTPGGKIVLFVPALACLYGSFDRLAGHYRRYDRRMLSERLESSGWAVRRLEYFNFPGILTWFLGGRVLCRKQMDASLCCGLDRLVPWLSFLEKIIEPPLGQSLFAVAENPL